MICGRVKNSHSIPCIEINTRVNHSRKNPVAYKSVQKTTPIFGAAYARSKYQLNIIPCKKLHNIIYRSREMRRRNDVRQSAEEGKGSLIPDDLVRPRRCYHKGTRSCCFIHAMTGFFSVHLETRALKD